MKRIALIMACSSILIPALRAAERPNILWIMNEDWGKDLSCYGTKGVETPNLDKLASEGILYENAFTTSPVCSTSRSAMMTGFFQSYIGANQHRLAKSEKKPLPYGIKPIPQIFQEAGYFTCLMSWKTDVNFRPCDKKDLFMGEDWSERAPGQPFFARITFGGTHRSFHRDPVRPIDIKDVELPPYYPDTDYCRRDWANGLEEMQIVDREVGTLLKRLDDEGLSNNTIVFFLGDNGSCHVRGKQFLYDAGISVPMMLRWPGKVAPGQTNTDLVMAIDIDATILDAAGIKAPVPLHGKDLFSKDVKERKYIFAERDRVDETHDSMRAIRSKDYKLILNLMPERPYMQYNKYKEGAYPMMAELNVMYMKGQLTPEQAAFMAPNKPEVELYDLRTDPFELHNVAEVPANAKVKSEMLAELENWRKNVIHDKGVSDEFRALNVFPAVCPTSTVDEWVFGNATNYDFNKVGAPPWYPTRTLAEWEKVRALWMPYLFQEPGSEVPTPESSINQSAKNKKKKNAKSKE